MKLYYGMGACSLAPHIVFHELGLKFDIEQVDMRKKQFSGGDFTKVNPKGYVPALQLDNGELLTEVQVIMQYAADQKPEAGLLPKAGSFERYRCLEWLNFIATEIHKGFGPFWNPATPEAYKEAVFMTLSKRFDFLTQHLSKNQFLMGDKFTAADAYLFTILNWTGFLKMDLATWPVLTAYMDRVKSRPAVQAAMKAEGLLH